jgi:hypothetical protein
MGDFVKAGEVYGVMVDAYTGQELTRLYSSQDAIVIPGGREWPLIGTTTVGILGTVDHVVDRRTTDLLISFD